MQPLIQTAKRMLFRSGTIVDVTDITPHMRQIRINAPSLQGVSLAPSQHIRINVEPERLMLRTYSIRRLDSERGMIDLYAGLHGQGPGRRWVETVQAGDQVEFIGPKSSLALITDAPYYLFVGEETATVAIHSMVESLPDQATVMGCLETTQAGEEIPYTGQHALPWVYRYQSPAAPSATLLEAVRELALPDTPGMAYLAGEALTCQAVRRYLMQEKRWPRTAIRVKPFWTPGKTGLD
jgi:NADPH-dependent ferric siderophore reductase